MSATVERAMAVEVDQSVHIVAPPERVWRALTELSDLRRWLFPSAEADVRAGGFWRFTFPHWPSARGLHHPALNFGGPIVELVPGSVLAVQFEPPYWGVLRFEIAAAGDGTDLRVTQRGFAGNEDWLADFRGGWGSFNDRLALLCEIGETATPQRIEATLAAERELEPGELAGALDQLATRTLPARPYWYANGSRVTLVVPGADAGNGYRLRREEPCDALCLVAPALGRPAGRAREPPALAPAPRLDRRGPAARGHRPRASRARLRARPALPPRARSGRARAVRARVRARVLRARARRRRRLLRSGRRVRARRRAAPAAARHCRSDACPPERSRASGACA